MKGSIMLYLFHSYCMDCRVEWHKGVTCKDYQLSKNSNMLDKMFMDFVNGSKFKRCKNCRYWVEKSEVINNNF